MTKDFILSKIEELIDACCDEYVGECEECLLHKIMVNYKINLPMDLCDLFDEILSEVNADE